MTYDDCIKKGKLKKSAIDGSVFSRTLKMAKEDLESAESSLNHGDWAWSIIQSYSAMLNISRAILFRDGYVEKSHYCVVAYLRHNHFDDLEDHIERLDLRPAGIQAVMANVPLAEMFGYATDLRSMTQGRGTFTMEFKHYAQVDRQVAEKILYGWR